MSRYPAAIWSPLPGIGQYTDGPFKIVHHTTQGGSAAGAIATYRQTGNYPHFTVENDVVYQHVDTNFAVTALEHPAHTIETNRGHAIQIELVGFAERPKSSISLRTMATLCRWLEQQHGIPPVWPNGYPYPSKNGHEPPGPFNRSAENWQTKGGHYGHCHVPNNHHWDPGYSADEVKAVMAGTPFAVAAATQLSAEAEVFEPMVSASRAFASDGFSSEIQASQALASAPDDLHQTPYVEALVRIVEGEYEAFHSIVETDEPLRSRIDEYCRDIGISAPSNISAFPWSATFVSWCIKKAGASKDEFTFSAAHAVFVRAAIANADAQIGVFRARPVDSYAPRVGDLIHRNRSGGTVTYAKARISSDYPSHSAIVVALGEDRVGRYAMTIGGNESDSIRRTRVNLTPTGLVQHKPTDPNPFICVVQDLKIEAPESAVASSLAATPTQRLAMAKIIVNFEARRDGHGRLMVYNLPPQDGGGRYEVAGINERYNKVVCDQLVQLIQNGQQAEAERVADDFIAENTDGAAAWTSKAAIEFYLRDCIFNRGTRGAAWILQTAVGVEVDQSVGPATLAAVTREEVQPLDLLNRLRQAREAYERLRRDETSIFWHGLVNRWNNALTAAKTFLVSGEAAAAPTISTAGPAASPAGAKDDQSQFDAPPLAPAPDITENRDPDPQAGVSNVADPIDVPAAAASSRPNVIFSPQVVASAAVYPSGPMGDQILQMHRELEGKLFAPKAAVAFAESVAPPPPREMIIGVGIGAAHYDFESVGPAGPGAPVLNVYVAEAMSMEAVKRVLVDHYGMASLASDRHPINIHHCGPIGAAAHMHRERPSPCGISVGHHRITAGTQGVLARGNDAERQRRLLILSNNHVLANENDCQAGDAIHQPGPLDLAPSPATQIGILERWVTLDFSGGDNFVDCATAWCTPGSATQPNVVRKEFIRQDAGKWSYFNVASQPVEAQAAMLVGKSGRTTQLTSGRVLDVNASISVNYANGKVANFKDQITITGNGGRAFSDGGDSGSLIWTWNEARSPVGLLFAGGRDYTFANKLRHVLQALDIQLYT